MATKSIKITDDRQGATFRTGINGKLFDLPVNQEFTCDEALCDHLEGIGVRFEEVETKRASSSKEGSVDELVRPIGAHDVLMAGTRPKSLNDSINSGDQPGDVTSAGANVQYSDGTPPHGSLIEDDAEVSNIRVAAERGAPKDASVAEKAGEGEQGTPKADAQPVKPSHKETDAEKADRKAAAARKDGK